MWSASGLKGIAAAFALDQLARAARGDAAPLATWRGEEDLFRDSQDGTLDAVCWAIGYDPVPLPDIQVDGSCVGRDTVRRNPATSELEWAGCTVPTRLFSLGIRDPEYFEESSAPAGRSPIGFGGSPCTREVRLSTFSRSFFFQWCAWASVSCELASCVHTHKKNTDVDWIVPVLHTADS